MVEISDDEIGECVVCTMIARNTFTCLECGCLVCEEHVQRLQECPKCRADKAKVVPCPGIRQMINKMTSKCKKGCGSRSKIKDLYAHEQECKGDKKLVLKEEVKRNEQPKKEKTSSTKGLKLIKKQKPEQQKAQDLIFYIEKGAKIKKRDIKA